MRFARLTEDGVVIDIIQNDPLTCYHPRLAAAFVPVSIEAPDGRLAARDGADGRCTPPL